MKKRLKILIGMAVLSSGIIGLLVGPYFILTIASLISIPSGLSLIISAVI